MRPLPRRIPAALVSACLLAGGCTYLLGRKIKSANNAGQPQMIRYVTPARSLEPGQVLEAADLSWTLWPAASAVSGAVQSTEHVVGRVILAPVNPGQPLLERELAETGTSGGLSSGIPKGMRAVALRSDEVAGVAGFLAPGSRVDVLVTYHSGQSVEPVTATVLVNVRVLAAGQQVKPDPSGKPATATVVTLLLSPVEAERAVLASAQGTVHFVLRNSLDPEQTGSEPVSLANLGGTASSFPHASAGMSALRSLEAAQKPVHTLRAPSRIETVYGDGEGSPAGRSNPGAQP